jgi:hypothetical protein
MFGANVISDKIAPFVGLLKVPALVIICAFVWIVIKNTEQNNKLIFFHVDFLSQFLLS